MVNMYRLLLNITVASFLNLFIYYVRRLPLIGRHIPETFYAARDFKRGASIAVFILSLIWAIIQQFMYIGLLIHLPAQYAVSEMARSGQSVEAWPVFLTLLFVLSFIGGPLWNARIMETKRSKYVAVKLIRISPVAYMRGTLSYRYISFALSFGIVLSLFAAINGANPLLGVLLGVALTGWRLLAEYVHLQVFRLKGWVPSKNNAYIWITLLGALALAYAPLLIDAAPSYGAYLLSLPAILFYIAIGVFAALRLYHYPNYAEAVDKCIKRDDPLLNLSQMMADSRKVDVETKADDYSLADSLSDSHSLQTDTIKANRLRGYAKLNDLFFRRHRRIVHKPLVTRLVIVSIACAIGSALLLMLGSPKDWTLHTLLPFLPFVFYSFSLGERLCRALFYNCDIPLLRYSFYREAALKHFGWRLLRLVGMNMTLGIAFSVALTMIAAVAGWPLTLHHLLPLWLTALALSILMSVHHLLLYYLLQPYTTEMNAKNPLFFLLNVALSATCWITIVFHPQPELIAGGALILALVYLACSFVLVRRFGSRTFRLK